MVNSIYSTALTNLNSAHAKALSAVHEVSSNPNEMTSTWVDLSQSQLQAEVAITTLKSIDESLGYLLDIIA